MTQVSKPTPLPVDHDTQASRRTIGIKKNSR